MARTADEIAAAWVAGLGRSGDKIRAGIAGVTTSPGQAAARQKSAYLNGVQSSAEKWARKVGAVTLADWQQAMSTKGVDRMATGASAAQGKFQSFMAKFLPHVMAGKNALPPRGGYEQNKARAIAMMDHNHKFTG